MNSSKFWGEVPDPSKLNRLIVNSVAVNLTTDWRHGCNVSILAELKTLHVQMRYIVFADRHSDTLNPYITFPINQFRMSLMRLRITMRYGELQLHVSHM